ncbi:MAG TPA: TolC family protein [Vicinamibacteria bacterium]|nr:TolC family protein [Vicinamibacteria bacterium]
MNEHPPKRAFRPLAGALLLGAFTSAAAGEEKGAPPGPPLTLRRTVELALANAPEVAAAAAGEAEAAAATRAAAVSPRPEVWASTSPGYAAGVPAPVMGQLPAIARVEVRASLFDPARRADEEQARARWAGASGSAAAARVRAARAAAETFSRCLLGEALVASAEARAAAFGTVREAAEAQAREGRLTELDAARARLAEAEARQAAAEARSGRELDFLALRRLTGWPDAEPLRLDPASADDLPDARDEPDPLDRARAADPELSALGRAATSMERSARLRGQVLSPVVEATAQYARLYKTADWDAYYPTFQPDSWAVAASVSIPLWRSDRAAAEEARARAGLDRVRADRRLREREVELGLRGADAALRRDEARLDLARQRESLAQESLRAARALAAEGRVDGVRVAEQEAALAESLQETARAEHDRRLARLERLALLGALPGMTAAAPNARDRP